MMTRVKELEAENACLKKMYIETQIKNDLLPLQQKAFSRK